MNKEKEAIRTTGSTHKGDGTSVRHYSDGSTSHHNAAKPKRAATEDGHRPKGSKNWQNFSQNF